MSELFVHKGFRLSATYPDVIRLFGFNGSCPYDFHEFPSQTSAIFRDGLNNGVKSNARPTRDDWSENRMFYTGDDGAFDPYTISIADGVFLKGSLSAKAFKAKQAAGHIVFQPYGRQTIDIHVQPGVLTSRVQNHDVSMTIPLIASPTEPINSCNFLPGPQWDISIPGFEKLELISSSQLSGISCRRSFDWHIDPTAYDPPRHLTEKLLSLVTDQLGEPNDVGLTTKVIADANNGEWDILTELGEAPETIKFVLGLAHSVVKAYGETRRSVATLIKRRNRLDKRDLAAARDLTDQIASLWMQYRYAVMPMMYSANDALDYLQHQFNKYESYRAGKTTQKELEFDGWKSEGIQIIDRVLLKRAFTGEIGTQGLGIGVFNTAQELIPLTFVLRWFVNVGDVLTSLSTPSNVNQQVINYSRQIRPGSSCVFTNDRYPGCKITINVAYYKSTPHDPLTQVGFQWNPTMTWKRWLDALALSWSFSKKLM